MSPSRTTAMLLSMTALAIAQNPAAPPPPSGDAATEPTTEPQPAPTLGDAWREAVRLAKLHKAPILAFVLPPADAPADGKRAAALQQAERDAGIYWHWEGDEPRSARDILLRQVRLLRTHGETDFRMAPATTAGHRVFALTIPVFATPTACGAEPGETVVLLGPDGQRLRGLQVDLGNAEQFVQRVSAIVATEAALAPRRANVPAHHAADLASVPEALRRLDEDVGYEPFWQLRKRLAPLLPAIAPALSGDDPASARMLQELEEMRAPHGSTEDIDVRAYCLTCGMGSIPSSRLATVLRLLAD